jgi:hypothetical protein
MGAEPAQRAVAGGGVILRRRALWRLGAALLLPAGAAVVLSPAAAGDPSSPAVTTSVLLTQAAYFWREQTGNIAGTGVAPPMPLTDPTVPSGDLAVAGPEINGQADKETYLEFDLSAVPAGSTITSFVVTLPVDPSGQSFTPTGTAPPIVACLPQGSWSGGTGPQPISGKPTDHCATAAPRFTSSDGGKTYTADIASIAQDWLTGVNTGVAVADDPSNSQTAFQVVFGPPNAISDLSAQMTYVPGPSPTTEIVPGPGSGTGAPFVPSTPSPLLSALPPGAPGAGAASGATPSTTGPPAPQSQTRSSAPLGRYALAGAAPPLGFWLAAVGLLALLLSASVVLGADPAVEPARRRRRFVLAGAGWGQRPGGGPRPPQPTSPAPGTPGGTASRGDAAGVGGTEEPRIERTE